MSPRIDNSRFRHITPGIETLPCNFSLPRHWHLRAYATVVLAGSFEESGYNGRIRATAGDVLIHPALDCHGNQMVSAGVKLIRLDWRDASGIGGLYHLDDVDEIARTAEHDVLEATHLLECVFRKKCLPSPGQRNDWPDLLLADLARNASTEIGDWAEVTVWHGRRCLGDSLRRMVPHPRFCVPNCERVRHGFASQEGPSASAGSQRKQVLPTKRI